MTQSYLSSHNNMENGGHIQYENKPSWRYQSCECCPYGYHIDLDFVRYCEALKDRADYTGSINKRRERRRQRQSMEVLLGLVTPVSISSSPTVPQINKQPLRVQNHDTNLKTALIQDALGDVVTDFERTLERSTGSNTFDHLSDIRDPQVLYRVSSNSSVSSSSGSGVWASSMPSTTSHQINCATGGDNGIMYDFENSRNTNAGTLKNIRKQMALGLERMRELEEQVKLIPALQVQVSVLKDEKRKLLEKIRDSKDLNKNLTDSPQTFTNLISRKEAGVMCGVLTRTIGVGPQYPRTRTTSTATLPDMPQVIECIPSPKHVFTKASQTVVPRIVHVDVQTAEIIKNTKSCYVSVKPDTSDCALQISSQMRTIGVSNDSIKDTFCNKCAVLTRTIGVGPSVSFDGLTPVSLKLLSVPRSKSFNLGEEKLNHNSKQRTIGCQSENFSINRACQYEPKVSSRACQYENLKKVVNKGVQYENISVFSQYTDTLDLPLLVKHVFTNTPIRSFSDVASNTMKIRLCDASFNTIKPLLCDAFSNTVANIQSSEDGVKKEDSASTISRIPRPSHSPATERHKLRRQDTYTKIPAPTTTSSATLSGLDLSSPTSTSTIDVVESECTSSFSKIKQNYKIQDINSLAVSLLSTEKNDVCSSRYEQVASNSATLPICESALLHPIDRSSRSKAIPSKEMQAAMKVLNDSLQKSKHNGSGMSSSAKSHLKNALSIIQQEWFKISSLVNANPLDVEDYLDRFEEISSSLLQYVVNMTDDSGNTAMHYAVSHGNFDVVSILLDSKVCNINKPNKAGYTSVMLVSLTEVRSATDATVVRRLFQLADVNVRARQHGQTALMLAVSHGRLDMVQMLLEAGADINIQDEDGSTALMCAAEHGHVEIVKYFLGHSECDSSIVDVDGSTALKIALEAGHKDIGVLLYAHEHSVHGISPGSPLRQRRPKATDSGASSATVSRSPSRGTFDNKHSSK